MTSKKWNQINDFYEIEEMKPTLSNCQKKYIYMTGLSMKFTSKI